GCAAIAAKSSSNPPPRASESKRDRSRKSGEERRGHKPLKNAAIRSLTTFLLTPKRGKMVEQALRPFVGVDPTIRTTFFRARGWGRRCENRMLALVFEAYGALCLFALVAFLIWAAVAKLRPDLDEEGFDVAELEKLSSSVQPADGSSSIEPVL